MTLFYGIPLSLLFFCFLSSCSSPDTKANSALLFPTQGVSLDILAKRADKSLLKDLEYQVFKIVNLYRVSQGKNVLFENEVLQEEARKHSQNIAQNRIPFGHDGAAERIRSIQAQIPLNAFSENVVSLFSTPEDLARYSLQCWVNSPGHKKNIVGTAHLTGIGVVQDAQGRYVITQIFAQPQK
jgi:uncharacterized protein YkwD